MITQILHCPNCQGTDIIRNGKTRQGKQRFLCREKPCDGRTFILDYSYAGQSKEVKKKIIDMAVNGSGVRDTARILKISTNTVLKELKKKENQIQQVNLPLLKQLNPEKVAVKIQLFKPTENEDSRESQIDEMWSYVGRKSQERWLWHAIDHKTGQVVD